MSMTEYFRRKSGEKHLQIVWKICIFLIRTGLDRFFADSPRMGLAFVLYIYFFSIRSSANGEKHHLHVGSHARGHHLHVVSHARGVPNIDVTQSRSRSSAGWRVLQFPW